MLGAGDPSWHGLVTAVGSPRHGTLEESLTKLTKKTIPYTDDIFMFNYAWKGSLTVDFPGDTKYCEVDKGGTSMFYDLLKSRRSIRKFQSKEVEREKLDVVLKSALLSPSSRARRPWEFIVVTDRALIGRLAACREHSSEFLAGAPVAIVVVADPELCDVWIEDASIASIIIQLSARSVELASCWIQVRERYHSGKITTEEYIKGVLNIPAKYRVECIVAIGYPAETKEPYRDDELRLDKIHMNKF